MRPTRRRFLASAALAAAAPRYLLGQQPTPAQLAQDPLRPQFHLLPPGNWMNDPNGPIVLNGTTHVFYQLNPHGPAWGDIHWGHATSTDLVHWQHQPVALSPSPGSSDQDGCWSGSALEHNGEVFAFYTGVVRVPRDKATCKGDISYRETQNLATAPASNPRLLKKQGLPVLDAPPAGLAVTGFRDPAPFRLAHDPLYTYMAVGSGTSAAGAILLYRSPDLLHWEYLHPLFQAAGNGKATSDPVDAGTMFECPDVFELDGHHVLLYSSERRVRWLTGHIDPQTLVFTPKQRGLLDTGQSFYAPKSMLHPTHGRILWGWLNETRPQPDYVRAGWAGAMALPRVLHVTSEGELTQTVPNAFQTISGGPASANRTPSLAARITATLPADTGFTVTSGDSTLATLQASPDGSQLLVNGTPLPHTPANPVTLWVDGSVLELFFHHTPDATNAAARAAHTFRAYPSLSSTAALAVNPIGRPTLAVRPVQPISSNRLTT